VLTVVSPAQLEVGVLGCRDVLWGRGGCADALTEVILTIKVGLPVTGRAELREADLIGSE
jgi:hypothetical protein